MDTDRPTSGPTITLATVDGQPAAPKDEQPVRQERNQRGRFKAWEPTSAERKLIELGLAAGMTQKQVAMAVGRSEDSLQRKCKDEIANGAAKCNAKVVEKLFQKCMKGDTIALLFWCKARLGWQDRQRVEHTGADGGSIKLETVEAEANDFTHRILAMATRFQDAAPSNDAEAAPEKPKRKRKCSPSS